MPLWTHLLLLLACRIPSYPVTSGHPERADSRQTQYKTLGFIQQPLSMAANGWVGSLYRDGFSQIL